MSLALVLLFFLGEHRQRYKCIAIHYLLKKPPNLIKE